MGYFDVRSLAPRSETIKYLTQNISPPLIAFPYIRDELHRTMPIFINSMEWRAKDISPRFLRKILYILQQRLQRRIKVWFGKEF